MEKMNQVSVSEFMSKSKEEMYDDAVAMVEKYNRLVDICNDSAERMAELMAKDDINEFKKELQSKAPGEFKIQKLADIVTWADSIIRDAGYNEEKYKSDGATAYCHVKAYELWRIRDVVLESMERRTVYSNALNNDIAEKAAKIDLLEKEIEGRKEGYYALKKRMDTDYITIDEHNNICKTYESEVKRLNRFLKMQEDLTRDWKNKYVEAQKEIDELESDTSEYETITQYQELVDGLKKDLNYWKEAFETQATSLAEVRKLNDELVDTLNKSSDEVEKLEKQVEYLKKELDQTCTCKELDLKGHQSREMALVNTLADKNDEIKELKEENSRLNARIKCDTEYWKKAFEAQSVPLADGMKLNESLRKTNDELVDTLNKSNARIEELEEENFKLRGPVDTDFINKLIQETDYYKEQERIRTDQLRATESKVEELYKQIEGLTNNARAKSTEIARLRKEMADIKHELSKEDDHGRAGFKRYIEHLIEEEERAVPERFKERLNEEITAIFTKEEETEVKGVGRTSSGRYPWGAKVNDIPCGEDAIE